MMPQQYCLRWKHHHSNVQSMFAQLLEKERFCDVTLYCSPSFVAGDEDGKGVSLRAHRVVLAACSELLGALLAAHEALGEPVLVIDGAAPAHLAALLDYMYTGEMNVHHSQLASLLKTAEELKIKGLTDIRWNSKDEPPDSRAGSVTATASEELKAISRKVEQTYHREEARTEEKFNVNGGPPPLIKLPTKEKIASPASVKRDGSDVEEECRAQTKRQRLDSEPIELDEDDKDHGWRHGSMNISAEPVWDPEAGCDEDWGEAPADIACFLHTRLRVDGDRSGEDSDSDLPPSTSSSGHAADAPRADYRAKPPPPTTTTSKMTLGPKSGPTDPRFTDVVKLNDYLRHGRRPQFWEEDYVKRVMEAIRLKELEMKQAAEILGVSYGTLYGRYRDAYGCINRPFRASRELWSTKSAAEVLERLKRGELPPEAAAQALGVSARDLYVHAHLATQQENEFEPIPIEIDASLRSQPLPGMQRVVRRNLGAVERAVKKVLVGMDEEASEPGPSTSPSLLMKSRPDLTIVAAAKAKDEAT